MMIEHKEHDLTRQPHAPASSMTCLRCLQDSILNCCPDGKHTRKEGCLLQGVK